MECSHCHGSGAEITYFMRNEKKKASYYNKPFKDTVRALAETSPDKVHPCRCCGSREDAWHEALGEHPDTHYDPDGPFAFNDSVPFCFWNPWVKKVWGAIFLQRCATAPSVADAAAFADRAVDLLNKRQLLDATSQAHESATVTVDGNVHVIND